MEYGTIDVSLPCIDRPTSHDPAELLSLGPLMYNEATDDGNADISRDIHERQFEIAQDDEQWDNKLFLHFGDALTASRLHGLKTHRSVCESAYGSTRWVLPVFGLWHLRLNYIKLILKNHWGGPNDDFASLYHTWHNAYTSRKTLDADNVVFDQAHALIVQSFRARIVALMIRFMSLAPDERPQEIDQIMAATVDPLDTESTHYVHHVQAWWYKQSLPTLEALIKWIYTTINDTRYYQKAEEEQDHEFLNHINFLANVWPYLLLTDAIKVSDIGLMRYAIKTTLIIFSGSDSTWNYQRELCYYYWLTCSPAADKELQDTVLLESLINRRGSADSYYEMDRANEIFNLYLKTVKVTRKTSSIPVSLLMDRYARTYMYMTQIRDRFDKIFTTVKGDHSRKSMIDHVWLLATSLMTAQHGSIPVRTAASMVEVPKRGSSSSTVNLHRKGLAELNSVINKFNLWRRNGDIGNTDPNEAPVDVDMLRQTQQHASDMLFALQHRQSAGLPEAQPFPSLVSLGMIQTTAGDPTTNRPPNEELNGDILDRNSSESEIDEAEDQDYGDTVIHTVPVSNQERLFRNSEVLPFDDSNLLPIDDYEDVDAGSFREDLPEDPLGEPDATRDEEDPKVDTFSQFDELGDDSDIDIPDSYSHADLNNGK
jgi:hypothetical protein